MTTKEEVFLMAAKAGLALWTTGTGRTAIKPIGQDVNITEEIIKLIELVKAKELDAIAALINDDAAAISYQSLAQYRSALLRAIRARERIIMSNKLEPVNTPEPYGWVTTMGSFVHHLDKQKHHETNYNIPVYTNHPAPVLIAYSAAQHNNAERKKQDELILEALNAAQDEYSDAAKVYLIKTATEILEARTK